MNKIPLCLIGCGGMGHRHLFGYKELEDSGISNVEVVAVCDNQKQNADFAAKEVERFLKVYQQTIAGPALTTLLFLAVFSLALGRAVVDVGGIKYIEFLAPGLIIMTMAQNAFTNTSSSLISSYAPTISIAFGSVQWSLCLQAYFAKSPAAFWNRWHISLSSLVRDYLYLPLIFKKRKSTLSIFLGLMPNLSRYIFPWTC